MVPSLIYGYERQIGFEVWTAQSLLVMTDDRNCQHSLQRQSVLVIVIVTETVQSLLVAGPVMHIPVMLVKYDSQLVMQHAHVSSFSSS